MIGMRVITIAICRTNERRPNVIPRYPEGSRTLETPRSLGVLGMTIRGRNGVMDWMTASIEAAGVVILLIWVVVPAQEFAQIFARIRRRDDQEAGDGGRADE